MGKFAENILLSTWLRKEILNYVMSTKWLRKEAKKLVPPPQREEIKSFSFRELG